MPLSTISAKMLHALHFNFFSVQDAVLMFAEYPLSWDGWIGSPAF